MENRFGERTLDELYKACQRRAATLLREGGAPIEPAQRERLDRDTAFLLLAVASRIHSGLPGVAALRRDLETRPGAIAETFSGAHATMAREPRYTVLVHASEYVLGGRAESWRRDARVDGARVYDLALGSDEGLRRVLQALEAIKVAGQ